MASPRPQSSAHNASTKGSHVDSPLRNEAGQQVNDKGEVIHIDPPAHRSNKVHGGGYDPPTEDLGPKGGNTSEQGGWVTERGYGTPILASDELKKHPDNEWRQPAVSPELERHGNEYTVNEDGTPQYITRSRPHSRSSSRNNNTQQRVIPSPAQFDRGGTPLESHKEYEPLFPEDEDEAKKPKSKVDQLKRPSVARHQFPSQDVWEDTPGSLQLETTVDTPQEPEEPKTAGGNGDVSPAKVFEDPEAETKRKAEITKEDQKSFLPDHTRQFAAENKHLGKVRDDAPSRPGMQQRFPSQDIWEDAPSHGHLETTVSTPQMEETNEYAEDSPIEQKPQVPARPSIPARPLKREVSNEDKKAPIIPERPKPQLPVRPTKPSSSENVPTVESQAGENESPQGKTKPPVPARPAGSKIAALQAGFLKDLNSKLGLGPVAPKVKEPEPEEEEKETAPLSDARKGRAKGPQRRKPAASPSPSAAAAETAVPKQKLDFGPVTAIWSFGEDGSLDVPAAKMAAQIQHALSAPAKADEPVATKDEADRTVAAEPSLSQSKSKESSEPTSTVEAVADKTPSTLEQVTSQASEAFQSVTSKVSSALQPQEPLVTETVPGSADAPGAFPGSGSGLENETDSKSASVEQKPVSTPTEEKKVEEVLPTTSQ